LILLVEEQKGQFRTLEAQRGTRSNDLDLCLAELWLSSVHVKDADERMAVTLTLVGLEIVVQVGHLQPHSLGKYFVRSPKRRKDESNGIQARFGPIGLDLIVSLVIREIGDPFHNSPDWFGLLACCKQADAFHLATYVAAGTLTARDRSQQFP
jgi:hypothetical protein